MKRSHFLKKIVWFFLLMVCVTLTMFQNNRRNLYKLQSNAYQSPIAACFLSYNKHYFQIICTRITNLHMNMPSLWLYIMWAFSWSHDRMIIHLFPGAGFSLHFSMQCYLQRCGSIDLSHHYRPAISCWSNFSGIETSIANICKCTTLVLHAVLYEWSAAWLKFVHKSRVDIRGFSQVNLDKLQLHKCAMQTFLLWHIVP